jgi:hypothetical protein
VRMMFYANHIFFVHLNTEDNHNPELILARYPKTRGGKNILLSGTAREHWKFSANNQVNRHSDTVTACVTLTSCQTGCHALSSQKKIMSVH